MGSWKLWQLALSSKSYCKNKQAYFFWPALYKQAVSLLHLSQVNFTPLVLLKFLPPTDSAWRVVVHGAETEF